MWVRRSADCWGDKFFFRYVWHNQIWRGRFSLQTEMKGFERWASGFDFFFPCLRLENEDGRDKIKNSIYIFYFLKGP